MPAISHKFFMFLLNFYYISKQKGTHPVAGPDLRGVPGGPSPRPPTNRGPPTKPFIFYFSFMTVAFMKQPNVLGLSLIHI